jgi:hypothetical protein
MGLEEGGQRIGFDSPFKSEEAHLSSGGAVDIGFLFVQGELRWNYNLFEIGERSFETRIRRGFPFFLFKNSATRGQPQKEKENNRGDQKFESFHQLNLRKDSNLYQGNG